MCFFGKKWDYMETAELQKNHRLSGSQQVVRIPTGCRELNKLSGTGCQALVRQPEKHELTEMAIN